MGTNYSFDRNFTNFVHSKLAIKQIYEPMNWLVQDLNKDVVNNVDINNGVDYFLWDDNARKIITVQERFREKKYAPYTDFTIRYERPFNSHEERKASEYFKLKADFFVYGIINSDKFSVNENAVFLKFAIIDLAKLKLLIDQGKVVIDSNLNSRTCRCINDILHCPINYNRDGSSTFVPIDILLLKKLFPETGVIVKSNM